MKLNLPYFGPVTVELPYLAGGLVGTLAVLGAIGYWAWGTGPSTIASGGPCVAKETFDITANDFAKGSSTAPITVVEYASMTCPHCARFNNNVLPHLEADYVGKGHVRYVFREFPLDSVAMTISVIGRCLPKDQYLPFVDLMYQTQEQWGAAASADELRASIKEMARRAGMSGDRFEECLTKSEPDAKKVDAVRSEGIKDYCVSGTPTIFMNGKVIASGEISYPDLDQKIRAEMTRLGKTPPPPSAAASTTETPAPAPTDGSAAPPTDGAAPPADGAAAPADGAGSPVEGAAPPTDGAASPAFDAAPSAAEAPPAPARSAPAPADAAPPPAPPPPPREPPN